MLGISLLPIIKIRFNKFVTLSYEKKQSFNYFFNILPSNMRSNLSVFFIFSHKRHNGYVSKFINRFSPIGIRTINNFQVIYEEEITSTLIPELKNNYKKLKKKNLFNKKWKTSK